MNKPKAFLNVLNCAILLAFCYISLTSCDSSTSDSMAPTCGDIKNMSVCKFAEEFARVDKSAAPDGCFVDTSGAVEVCAKRYKDCSTVLQANATLCAQPDVAKSGPCYLSRDGKCAPTRKACSEVPLGDCGLFNAIGEDHWPDLKHKFIDNCFIDASDPQKPVCTNRYMGCHAIPKNEMARCALPGSAGDGPCYVSQAYSSCWKVQKSCADVIITDCKNPSAVRPGLKCFIIETDVRNICATVAEERVNACNRLTNQEDCENYLVLVEDTKAPHGCLWAKSSSGAKPRCWTKVDQCSEISPSNLGAKEHCSVPGIRKNSQDCSWLDMGLNLRLCQNK